MEKIYYAKSVSENGHQETNNAHLTKVSKLAGKFGAVFEQECEAALCGKLHDFVKYSESFEEVLKGTKRNIDHSKKNVSF